MYNHREKNVSGTSGKKAMFSCGRETRAPRWMSFDFSKRQQPFLCAAAQDPPNLRTAPATAPCGRQDLPSIQLGCNGPETRAAGLPERGRSARLRKTTAAFIGASSLIGPA